MAKKIIIVIVVVTIIFGMLFCFYKSYTENVTNSVKYFKYSINDIFVPNRIAERYYYDERGIDSYRFWIYKLKPKEIEKVNSDIANEKYILSSLYKDFQEDCEYFFENNISVDDQHTLYCLSFDSFFVLYDETDKVLVFVVKTI